MIFKNKKIRLPAGENLTFFALDENSVYLYLYKDGIKKKRIIFGNIVRCESLPYKVNCEYVKQLSEDDICLCFDGNISILKNEK